MSDDFKDVKEQLREINTNISSINSTTIRQQVILEEHIRRTEALERTVDLFQAEFRPLQKSVNMAEGVLKFSFFAAAAVTILAGLAKLFILLFK